jgi:hypothetical protein
VCPPSAYPPAQKIKEHSAPAWRSPRHQLGKYYAALRQLGFSDEVAQGFLRETREAEVREAEAQETVKARQEAQDYTNSIEARLAAFMEPARRWLLQNSGYFTPAMVAAKAREMAEHDLHMRQTPRLPDEWTRAQISAPMTTPF